MHVCHGNDRLELKLYPTLSKKCTGVRQEKATSLKQNMQHVSIKECH